jgi:hypothetical protein
LHEKWGERDTEQLFLLAWDLCVGSCLFSPAVACIECNNFNFFSPAFRFHSEERLQYYAMMDDEATVSWGLGENVIFGVVLSS